MSISSSQPIGCYGLDDDGKKDRHHLLWTSKHWQNGFAAKLCSHPYMKIYIPTENLHHVIHQVVTEIPVPEGKLCKLAFDSLNTALEQHELSIPDDPPRERLAFLIALWDHQAPSTVEALAKQQELFDAYQKDNLHSVRSSISAKKAAHKTAIALAALADLDPNLIEQLHHPTPIVGKQPQTYRPTPIT